MSKSYKVITSCQTTNIVPARAPEAAAEGARAEGASATIIQMERNTIQI